ncbi:hypothetical protein QR98_0091670 [Sarcoptes scabiei]|uniref:Uncharacterized protein n=1 Tax=Sarcoptes scabiei TaxID=52283 RepID=A0A132AHY1_SARSC|nr:hypothetical protein QR98_0091670 [Sarcoptes scabiei]
MKEKKSKREEEEEEERGGRKQYNRVKIELNIGLIKIFLKTSNCPLRSFSIKPT